MKLQSLEAPYCRVRASLHSVEDLRKCLSYSCKLLLKRVIAVSPAFVPQIAYKNAIQFGNTSGEEKSRRLRTNQTTITVLWNFYHCYPLWIGTEDWTSWQFIILTWWHVKTFCYFSESHFTLLRKFGRFERNVRFVYSCFG